MFNVQHWTLTSEYCPPFDINEILWLDIHKHVRMNGYRMEMSFSYCALDKPVRMYCPLVLSFDIGFIINYIRSTHFRDQNKSVISSPVVHQHLQSMPERINHFVCLFNLNHKIEFHFQLHLRRCPAYTIIVVKCFLPWTIQRVKLLRRSN